MGAFKTELNIFTGTDAQKRHEITSHHQNPENGGPFETTGRAVGGVVGKGIDAIGMQIRKVLGNL